MQLLFWDEKWCYISLLGPLLWKWSSAIQRILQSLCFSAVIKQGASEVKTSYWLLHTGSSQNKTSGVPERISAITCMERKSPNMLLSVLFLVCWKCWDTCCICCWWMQGHFGHCSRINLICCTYLRNKCGGQILKNYNLPSCKHSYQSGIFKSGFTIHIRMVFLRVVFILRTLLLLFTIWGLFLIKSPQISNTCS